MTWIATFNNPEYNYSGGRTGLSATVQVTGVQANFQFGTVSNCGFSIAHDVISKYSLETDDTNNPTQLNGTFLLQLDGLNVFRGYLTEDPVQYQQGGVRMLKLVGEGKDGVLLNALCPDANGEMTWTLRTSTFNVGASTPYLPLKKSDEFGTFIGSTLWPDPEDAEGAKCYIQDADCQTDTAYGDAGGGTITAATAAPFDLLFTTTDKKFAPQGWLKNNNTGEWFYYEGYDNTGAGGRYKVSVKERAALDTTADDIDNGDTFYQKTAKIIGPEPPNVYKDTGGGAPGVAIREGEEYSTQHVYGCFAYNGEAGSDDFYGNYYVYDSDQSLDGGSTVITIEDVVEALVTAPDTYGGAGFAAGDCNFSASAVGITRYDYDPTKKSKYAWGAIQELIKALNLADEYQFWYDHETDKFRLELVENAGAADVTMTKAHRIQQERSLKDAYSGVIVEYTNDQNPNLVQQMYSDHVDYAGAGAAPEVWRKTTAEGKSWGGTSTTLENPDGQDPDWGFDVLVDGRLDTNLRAEISHDPGGEFIYSWHWFGSGNTPPTIRADEIIAEINAYRSNADRSRANENETYVMRIDGCNDFDATDQASIESSGTWYVLGRIEGIAERDGETVKLEIDAFIVREINAIRLVWEYMAGPVEDGHKYWATCHRLIVRGNITKYQFVQTSASTENDPLFVYDVAAHTKLRGGVNADGAAGSPRVKYVKIGAASDEGAISLARTYLTNSLILYKRVTYTRQGALTALPALGKTVETDEDGSGAADYTGVSRGWGIRATAKAGTVVTYTVMDTDAASIA